MQEKDIKTKNKEQNLSHDPKAALFGKIIKIQSSIGTVLSLDMKYALLQGFE